MTARKTSAKAILIFFVAVIVVLFPGPSMLTAEVKIGEKAPGFTLQDSNGKERSLSEFLGKTVVLEWTNHLCPYVRKHYASDNMQSIQKKYTSAGIVWLTVNSSAAGKQGHVSAEEANEIIKEKKSAPSAYLLDPTGQVGKLYGARTTPHMYIVDSKGVLVYAGAIDDNSSSKQSAIPTSLNYVSHALEQIQSGEAIVHASTEPYGCSVKYAG